MTEDEAGQKQCCGPEGCGYEHPDNHLRRCIASACMAWEPDNYWVKDGRYCSKETEGAEALYGGDCGLKSKECGCR